MIGLQSLDPGATTFSERTRPMSIESKITTITPQDAEKILSMNPENRRISGSSVNALVRDMKAGRFLFNGDSIRIREDGVLADGQHRLTACVQSGIPFETILITGLPKDTVTTIDTGRKRTIGDILTITGSGHGNHLAATVRTLAILAKREFTARPTVGETMTILENHPGISDSAYKVYRRTTPLRPGLLAAYHYITTTTYGRPEDADMMVRVMMEGIPSYKGCPIHRLREVLIREKNTGRKIIDSRLHGLVFGAWRNFMNRDSITMLKPSTGFGPERWTHKVLENPATSSAPGEVD